MSKMFWFVEHDANKRNACTKEKQLAFHNKGADICKMFNFMRFKPTAIYKDVM